MSPPITANPVASRTPPHMPPSLHRGVDAGAFRQSLQTEVGRASKSPVMSRASAAGLEGMIQKAARTYNLDPKMIAGVIQAQSNFDSKAVSPAGAQGLMQLMPETAAELGISDAFNPEQNIMAGSRYLKSLVDRYDGDMGLALRAYSWGMGNVDRNPNTPPAEVEQFVARVSAAASADIPSATPSRVRLAKVSAMNHARPAPETTRDAIQQRAERSGYGNLIQQAAARFELSPSLITAVIHAESDFDNRVVSHAGAQGLMQLMPETAADLGVSNPFDPEQNIMGGSRYLKQLVNRYNGDLALALAAYNWGMGNLERHPGRLPLETSNYVAKVMALIPDEVRRESDLVAAREAANPLRLQASVGQAAHAYSRGSMRGETDV